LVPVNFIYLFALSLLGRSGLNSKRPPVRRSRKE
jgi:hypothetical protein